MRFLYKIQSNYDGFTPSELPRRMQNRQLRLSWKRYIDEVSNGDEVWIYFYGRHRFTYGVYAKGIVKAIAPNEAEGPAVYVRVTQSQTDSPLTDPATSDRVAEAVSTWYRQVFLFPQHLDIGAACKLHSTAETCKQRLCDTCGIWRALPRIKKVKIPSRLSGLVCVFAPAYWLIPKRRCYLRDHELKQEIHTTSEIFYRFKTGERELAYPLACGMFEVLKNSDALDFDCVVPIPLSPDKIANEELHRTKVLAKELSRLMDVELLDVLSLAKPISKRRGNWVSKAHFEQEYCKLLQVSEKIQSFKRILLVDDACTHGSTLECARTQILNAHPNRSAVVIGMATAGQMIVKEVMSHEAEVMA